MSVTSGYQMLLGQLALARPSLANLDEKLFPKGGLNAKSLIEISGEPNTGKSVLLWQIMARILPPIAFGGTNCDVLFIDLAHKFHIGYFLKYLKRVINESGNDISEPELNGIALKCLDSATIIKCYTNDEFDLSFDAIEDILLKNRKIAFLAIDNLDAYYWLDCYKKLIRMSTHYAQNFDRIKHLCVKHNICCAFTADENYVGGGGKSKNPYSLSQTVNVEYKMKLKKSDDEKHYLNEREIYITDDGIHFTK